MDTGATATNTSSPGITPKKDDPKFDPQTGRPIVPPGAVAGAPAPANLPPVAPGSTGASTTPTDADTVIGPPLPAPRATTAPAPATPPNIALTSAQIAPGAQTSLFSDADRASKEAIEAGRNQKDIAMQSALLASRQPRHLDISGRPITNTQSPFRDEIIFDSQTEARRKANERAHNMGKSPIPTSEALTATQTPELTAQYAANTKQRVDAAKAAFLDSQGMSDTGAQTQPNSAARVAMGYSMIDPARRKGSPYQALTQATGGKAQADERISFTQQWQEAHPGVNFPQSQNSNWKGPVEFAHNSLTDPEDTATFTPATRVMATGQKYAESTPNAKLATQHHELIGHAPESPEFKGTNDFITGKTDAPYMRQATEVMARLRQLSDLNGGGMHPRSETQALDLLSAYGFVEPGSRQKAKFTFTKDNFDLQDLLYTYQKMTPKEQQAFRKNASIQMPGTAQNTPFKPTGAFGGDTQVA